MMRKIFNICSLLLVCGLMDDIEISRLRPPFLHWLRSDAEHKRDVIGYIHDGAKSLYEHALDIQYLLKIYNIPTKVITPSEVEESKKGQKDVILINYYYLKMNGDPLKKCIDLIPGSNTGIDQTALEVIIRKVDGYKFY